MVVQAQTTSITTITVDSGSRTDQEGNLYRPITEAGVDFYKVGDGEKKLVGKRYVLQEDGSLRWSGQPLTVKEGSLNEAVATAAGVSTQSQTIEQRVQIASDKQRERRKYDKQHMYYGNDPELQAALDEYRAEHGIKGEISAADVARGDVERLIRKDLEKEKELWAISIDEEVADPDTTEPQISDGAKADGELWNLDPDEVSSQLANSQNGGVEDGVVEPDGSLSFGSGNAKSPFVDVGDDGLFDLEDLNDEGESNEYGEIDVAKLQSELAKWKREEAVRKAYKAELARIQKIEEEERARVRQLEWEKQQERQRREREEKRQREREAELAKKEQQNSTINSIMTGLAIVGMTQSYRSGDTQNFKTASDLLAATAGARGDHTAANAIRQGTSNLGGSSASSYGNNCDPSTYKDLKTQVSAAGGLGCSAGVINYTRLAKSLAIQNRCGFDNSGYLQVRTRCEALCGAGRCP